MAYDKLTKDLTWVNAAKDDSIISLEHPLMEMAMEKAAFYTTFQPVCDLLDGEDMSSYVDFFFERSPVQPTYVSG